MVFRLGGVLKTPPRTLNKDPVQPVILLIVSNSSSPSVVQLFVEINAQGWWGEIQLMVHAASINKNIYMFLTTQYFLYQTEVISIRKVLLTY